MSTGSQFHRFPRRESQQGKQNKTQLIKNLFEKSKNQNANQKRKIIQPLTTTTTTATATITTTTTTTMMMMIIKNKQPARISTVSSRPSLPALLLLLLLAVITSNTHTMAMARTTTSSSSSSSSSLKGVRRTSSTSSRNSLKSAMPINNDNNHNNNGNGDTVEFSRVLRNDDKKGPKERDCKIHAKKQDEIRYKCKSKSSSVGGIEIEDEIEFKVKLEDSMLEVEVAYEQEVETNETETETETSYIISFEKIIEYESSSSSTNDTETEAAYDWENDNIVQEIMLDNFGSLSDVVDSDDGITSTFNVSTADGVAEFVFTISRAEMSETLSANKMKIDFRLLNFPWLNSNSSSSVALISSIESKRKIKVKEEDVDDDEDSPEGKKKNVEEFTISFDDAVDTVGFVPVGEYTWETVANSTNITTGETEEVQVVATVSPSSSGKDDTTMVSKDQIAFSFVGASGSDDIFWDPSAGVEYVASSSASSVTTSTSSSSSMMMTMVNGFAGILGTLFVTTYMTMA